MQDFIRKVVLSKESHDALCGHERIMRRRISSSASKKMINIFQHTGCFCAAAPEGDSRPNAEEIVLVLNVVRKQ